MDTGANPSSEFHNFAAAEDVPISCPICECPMPSLYRLNEHLDSEHSNDDSTQAIVSWLKNAQKRVLNPLSKAATLPKIARSRLNELELNEPQFQENITRDHWQRERNNDVCSHVECNKPLNLKNGKENCRKCGKLFCNFHTQYQMRLNISAEHDPLNGRWYRVCEDCYTARTGYSANEGACRNRTEMFIKLRNKTVDKVLLESNRLEKRLDKLARAYSSPGTPSGPGFFNSIPRIKPQRKSSEQSIVKWEEDNTIKECPFCGIVFGKIRNRRHHCRLCGRVVCGSDTCSSNIPLTSSIALGTYGQNKQAGIKACRDCRNTISRRKENMDDSQTISPVIELYQALSKHRSIIDRTLPKFNQMISILGSINGLTESHMDFQKAAQIRKRLLDSFSQFDTISKKINSLATNSPWERQLQSNIHLAATQYLQTYMFSLSLLPKLFKKDSDDSHSITTTTFDQLQNEPDAGQKKGKNSEILDVLQEQYTQVQGFLHEATKQRRFDDVRLLKQSLNDLAQEMEKLRT
ncbi:hypothetical protein K493DRAFT_292756 [Basidiobolus meristosporus CBS 931.73]|uniref:FYVE-type domain-containing protein n=1 Tax=Basidiobolus meristosporus CBS 931.73 TaxID=1314790 RepID=A0A1Y1X6U2_9FUNG|nr:hypothetical protein K493DRAFT_292756 [Basidiobolus meristosporus CBS 931.73]|eukprot:ORX81408.1 hypothetical protein K493DRAFT_292756 [Basidiobolus meristosporus CBS 931.73]